MSEDTNEKSFAELFESSEMAKTPEFKVGDRIQGRIISVGKDSVFVDTGSKIDGVADKQALLDKSGNLPFKEGDTVTLFVVSRLNNEIRLAKSMSGDGGLDELQRVMEEGTPVEGKVKETCNGGFRVRVMDQTAFCPLSQIDMRPVEKPEVFVGQVFPFLVTRVEERGRNIVVSRRALLEKEQAESLAKLISQTKPGDILEGTVTRVVPFGAFVEVAPGLEGLVHISELSWSRTAKSDALVAPGDKVQVKLLAVEDQGKGRVRLNLSMKQMQTDPWTEAAAKFQAGMKISGPVVRIAPFGVFVEIAPGIEGLVHISEMSYLKRVHKPEEFVQVGDVVPVMVKEVDATAKRIGLSMRDAEGDPWVGVSDRFPKGKAFQGVLEKREKFGMFIRLEPGVVGLMPSSLSSKASGDSLDKLKPGDSVAVCVDAIDPEKRRISLAPAEVLQSEEWKSYSPEAPKEEVMGSLGEKLKLAMKAKE